MSYCVEYDPQMKKRYPPVKKMRKKPSRAMLIWGVAVIAIFVAAGSGVLRYLIPGDPDVTTAAFSTLVENIGEGEPVGDAFMTFCREIIINAT